MHSLSFAVLQCVRLDFCACTRICAELDACMYTPDIRQKDARHAQSALGQCQTHVCGAHAGYSLYVRRLRSSELLADTQHASNACPARNAWAILSAR